MAAQRRHIESEEGSEEGSSGPRWPPYFECCPGMDPTFDSDWEDEEWDESGNLVNWPHRSAREEEPEYNSSGGGPPARSAEKSPQRRSRRTRHRPPRKSICEEGNVWGHGWAKLACLNCGYKQWTRRWWPRRDKNYCGWCRYWWDAGYFEKVNCAKTR